MIPVSENTCRHCARHGFVGTHIQIEKQLRDQCWNITNRKLSSQLEMNEGQWASRAVQRCFGNWEPGHKVMKEDGYTITPKHRELVPPPHKPEHFNPRASELREKIIKSWANSTTSCLPRPKKEVQYFQNHDWMMSTQRWQVPASSKTQSRFGRTLDG